MAAKDLTITFQVDQTPHEVFNAVNNVRGWWSEGIEGDTQELNDEFIYRHKDIHYSKQKLIELVPDQRVVWLVTDSRLNFLENKTEWTGTTIHFEINSHENKTELRFTHMGLTPGVECYEACLDGWGMYARNSLYQFITTGKGAPDPKNLK